MVRHAGRLEVSGEILLAMFKFEGGKIHFIGPMPEKLKIGIVIEHPDMPEVPEGGEIPNIDPVMIDMRYKRIFPKPGWRYRLRSYREALLRKFHKLKISSERI